MIDGFPADENMVLRDLFIDPVPVINVFFPHSMKTLSLHFLDYVLCASYPDLLTMGLVSKGFNSVRCIRY